MENSEQPAFHVAHGLTKREYFAAMAMQGMLSDPQWSDEFECLDIAEVAVDHADALIKKLEETK